MIKKSLGIPINVPVVMTIGAFKPQKNLGDFIDLANNVHRQLPDVRFVLVGDGVLRPELENKSRSLCLESILQMPGWREDATQLLSIADIFVMTSLWEGLPRSLVEAMVLGIPSICYEADGVEDLLNVNEGSLISKRDVSELTKRVLLLLKNDVLRLKLGQEMKSRIGKDFDIDEMVLQQDRLYQELLVDKFDRIH
jgi:glycosyltransferase involved in cell wall biosynthesis